MSKNKLQIQVTHRIFAIGAAGVLGILIIAAIYFFGTQKEEQTRLAAENQQAYFREMSNIYVKIVESHRAEKNFLLDRDKKYITDFNNISKSTFPLIKDLEARVHDDDFLSKNLQFLNEKFSKYTQEFNAMSETRLKLGLTENAGLEGSLRDSVHAIEKKLAEFKKPELTVTMLMMRRHEKDFMLRRTPKYGAEMKKRASEFLAGLEASDIPPADKAELKQKLADYQHEFRSWFDTAIKLAEEEQASSATFAKIQPTVESIKAEIEKRYDIASKADDRAQSITTLAIKVAILLIALGVLSIALFIGRSISRPMTRIIRSMNELALGDLSTEVPGTERSDELGQMARALLVFKDSGLERERLAAMTEEERRLRDEERERNAAAQARAAQERAAEQARAAQALAEEQTKAAQEIAQQQAKAAEERAAAQAQAAREIAAQQAKAAEERAAAQEKAAQEKAAEQARIAEEQNRVVSLLADGLRKLSEGDLTIQITESMPDAYIQLGHDFNSAVSRLRSTIGTLSEAARDVASASSEISTSTTDLSQRTEEQAASLEQTSASMEQISATIKNNTQHAQQANILVAETSDIAGRGGHVVANTVDAMSRIAESSRRIADITGVIDEIARQTNLLALNAAVEAARAGEAGRGFAVVASEVRSLAQRSSHAAKDINDLIATSSAQVGEGVELVNQTGASLNEIIDSVRKVASLVSEIASASVEQSGGVEQINKALAQMDETTQQNSALVEENAATAKTLEQQARTMAEQIAFFRIDGTTGRARPAAPAPSGIKEKQPAPTRQSVVGRMRSSLATALKTEPEWQEF